MKLSCSGELLTSIEYVVFNWLVLGLDLGRGGGGLVTTKICNMYTVF